MVVLGLGSSLSVQESIPSCRAISDAVVCWSPVIMMVRMPASRQLAIADLASSRSGSLMPNQTHQNQVLEVNRLLCTLPRDFDMPIRVLVAKPPLGVDSLSPILRDPLSKVAKLQKNEPGCCPDSVRQLHRFATVNSQWSKRCGSDPESSSVSPSSKLPTAPYPVPVTSIRRPSSK